MNTTETLEPPETLLNMEIGQNTSPKKKKAGRVFFPNAIPVKPLEFDRSKIKKHSKKEIQQAGKALKEKYSTFSSTANWLVPNDGKNWDDVAPYTSKPCHANLISLTRDNHYDGLIATENGAKRVSLKDKNGLETYRPFLSWFLYESPYGEFILNRDNFHECLKYGFVFSFSLPQPIFMNMCIISRHFYEINKESFEIFNKLTLQEKLDPTICYSMIFNSYFSNSPTLSNAHMSFCGHRVTECYEPSGLKNIFNGVYGENLNQKNIKDTGKFSGASLLFKDSNHTRNFHSWAVEQEEFIDFLKKQRKGNEKVEKYSPPNPFKPTTYNFGGDLGRGRFTNKEAFDFVIHWLDALIRKEL